MDSLFDAVTDANLTVQSTQEKLRAKQIAQGDTAAGRKAIFEAATIRQITLSFPWSVHRKIVGRLEKILKQAHVKTPSELLPKLLDLWEKSHEVEG